MGQAESNESAAVKRQAEGGAVPMYGLLDLSGKIKNDYCQFQLLNGKKSRGLTESLNISI